MIARQIETGRCYGMVMNVENTNVMRIWRQPSPVEIMAKFLTPTPISDQTPDSLLTEQLSAYQINWNI
jgi:hypothetical protein